MLRKIYSWSLTKFSTLLQTEKFDTEFEQPPERVEYIRAVSELSLPASSKADQILKKWIEGDHCVLADIETTDLTDHPNRVRLALAIGAANQQIGNFETARKFILAARNWGCSRETILAFLAIEASKTLSHARDLLREPLRKKLSKVPQQREHTQVSEQKYANFMVDEYWEHRYKSGGNSGFGSYGRLAGFKARIINSFIEENNIDHIIELGCGDGNQLSMIRVDKYTGIDISPTIIQICRKKFEADSSKKFFTATEFAASPFKAKLTLSLDVIFHLVRDDIFTTYMTALLDASDKFCIIYASNSDNRVDPATHVRHRKFSAWITENKPEWQLFDTIENDFPHDNSINPRDVSFSDFYFYRRIP